MSARDVGSTLIESLMMGRPFVDFHAKRAPPLVVRLPTLLAVATLAMHRQPVPTESEAVVALGSRTTTLHPEIKRHRGWWREILHHAAQKGPHSSALVGGERHPHVHLLEDVGAFFAAPGDGSCGPGGALVPLVDVVGLAADRSSLESVELAAIICGYGGDAWTTRLVWEPPTPLAKHLAEELSAGDGLHGLSLTASRLANDNEVELSQQAYEIKRAIQNDPGSSSGRVVLLDSRDLCDKKPFLAEQVKRAMSWQDRHPACFLPVAWAFCAAVSARWPTPDGNGGRGNGATADSPEGVHAGGSGRVAPGAGGGDGGDGGKGARPTPPPSAFSMLALLAAFLEKDSTARGIPKETFGVGANPTFARKNPNIGEIFLRFCAFVRGLGAASTGKSPTPPTLLNLLDNGEVEELRMGVPKKSWGKKQPKQRGAGQIMVLVGAQCLYDLADARTASLLRSACAAIERSLTPDKALGLPVWQQDIRWSLLGFALERRVGGKAGKGDEEIVGLRVGLSPYLDWMEAQLQMCMNDGIDDLPGVYGFDITGRVPLTPAALARLDEMHAGDVRQARTADVVFTAALRNGTGEREAGGDDGGGVGDEGLSDSSSDSLFESIDEEQVKEGIGGVPLMTEATLPTQMLRSDPPAAPGADPAPSSDQDAASSNAKPAGVGQGLSDIPKSSPPPSSPKRQVAVQGATAPAAGAGMEGGSHHPPVASKGGMNEVVNAETVRALGDRVMKEAADLIASARAAPAPQPPPPPSAPSLPSCPSSPSTAGPKVSAGAHAAQTNTGAPALSDTAAAGAAAKFSAQMHVEHQNNKAMDAEEEGNRARAGKQGAGVAERQRPKATAKERGIERGKQIAEEMQAEREALALKKKKEEAAREERRRAQKAVQQAQINVNAHARMGRNGKESAVERRVPVAKTAEYAVGAGGAKRRISPSGARSSGVTRSKRSRAVSPGTSSSSSSSSRSSSISSRGGSRSSSSSSTDSSSTSSSRTSSRSSSRSSSSTSTITNGRGRRRSRSSSYVTNQSVKVDRGRAGSHLGRRSRRRRSSQKPQQSMRLARERIDANSSSINGKNGRSRAPEEALLSASSSRGDGSGKAPGAPGRAVVGERKRSGSGDGDKAGGAKRDKLVGDEGEDKLPEAAVWSAWQAVSSSDGEGGGGDGDGAGTKGGHIRTVLNSEGGTLRILVRRGASFERPPSKRDASKNRDGESGQSVDAELKERRGQTAGSRASGQESLGSSSYPERMPRGRSHSQPRSRYRGAGSPGGRQRSPERSGGRASDRSLLVRGDDRPLNQQGSRPTRVSDSRGRRKRSRSPSGKANRRHTSLRREETKASGRSRSRGRRLRSKSRSRSSSGKERRRPRKSRVSAGGRPTDMPAGYATLSASALSSRGDGHRSRDYASLASKRSQACGVTSPTAVPRTAATRDADLEAIGSQPSRKDRWEGGPRATRAEGAKPAATRKPAADASQPPRRARNGPATRPAAAPKTAVTQDAGSKFLSSQPSERDSRDVAPVSTRSERTKSALTRPPASGTANIKPKQAAGKSRPGGAGSSPKGGPKNPTTALAKKAAAGKNGASLAAKGKAKPTSKIAPTAGSRSRNETSLGAEDRSMKNGETRSGEAQAEADVEEGELDAFAVSQLKGNKIQQQNPGGPKSAPPGAERPVAPAEGTASSKSPAPAGSQSVGPRAPGGRGKNYLKNARRKQKMQRAKAGVTAAGFTAEGRGDPHTAVATPGAAAPAATAATAAAAAASLSAAPSAPSTASTPIVDAARSGMPPVAALVQAMSAMEQDAAQALQKGRHV